MKKWVIILAGVIVAFTLTACSSAKLGTNKKQDDKVIAKNDAQTVLDFMYKGNISGFSDISDDSALKVDGSVYTADDIIKEYAKAYYEQIATIGKATIKSIKLTGDSAKVTASITPIAGLSEANPIGNARTELFGGIDNDTIIRDSQNKDVKTIQKLITLKLYGIYYGQMAKTAEKAKDPINITFTMKKDDDHFKVDEDTIVQLAKDSRAQVYAPGQSADTSSDAT